ncbi:MAG: Uncharacterised protein [SAR116 cluster bacterium]|nr:MAG: Uncharacterised protein [SAR116 cluster bacterium]
MPIDMRQHQHAAIIQMPVPIDRRHHMPVQRCKDPVSGWRKQIYTQMDGTPPFNRSWCGQEPWLCIDKARLQIMANMDVHTAQRRRDQGYRLVIRDICRVGRIDRIPHCAGTKRRVFQRPAHHRGKLLAVLANPFHRLAGPRGYVHAGGNAQTHTCFRQAGMPVCQHKGACGCLANGHIGIIRAFLFHQRAVDKAYTEARHHQRPDKANLVSR